MSVPGTPIRSPSLSPRTIRSSSTSSSWSHLHDKSTLLLLLLLLLLLERFGPTAIRSSAADGRSRALKATSLLEGWFRL